MTSSADEEKINRGLTTLGDVKSSHLHLFCFSSLITSCGWINVLVRAEPGSAAWDQGSSPSLYRMTQPIQPTMWTISAGAPSTGSAASGSDLGALMWYTGQSLPQWLWNCSSHSWQRRSGGCGQLQMRQFQWKHSLSKHRHSGLRI